MKKFLVLALTALWSGVIFAQTTVRGTITASDDGQPVAYANVQVEGTKNLVFTDENGKYTINAPADATLLVTYMGYANQLVPINNRSVINIVLQPDAVALDETIVVAYGTAKKGTYTGSAAVVNSDVLAAKPLTTVTQALTGTTAGVQIGTSNGQPGSAPTIRIRGLGSFNASNSPLVVLDGMPYDNSISSINTEDIDNITILKDASSTALYGARAANGVVLINTKRGKGDKTVVNAKYSLGLTTRQNQDYQRQGLSDYMETFWEATRNKMLYEDNYSVEQANAQAASTLMAGLVYNPFLMEPDKLFTTDGKFNKNAKVIWADDTDWEKAMLQVGLRHDANVSISGASDKIDYYTSVGYTQDEGYVRGSDYKRYSAKSNVNSKITKWLKVGTNLSFSMAESNGNQNETSGSITNPFRFLRNVSDIYPIHMHDAATGDYILDSDGNKLWDFGFGYSNGDISSPKREFLSGSNPAIELKNRYDGYRRTNVNAKAYAEVSFLKDFKFAVNVGLGANRYKGWSGDYVYPEKGNAGSSTKSHSETTTWTINQILSYTKDLGKHHIDVMAGHESYDYSYEYLKSAMKGQIMIGDNFEFGNYTEASGTPSSYINSYRVEGYLSRLNYDYNNKYFFSASYRRDGSSRFEKSSRWGNFWSIGGGWRIDMEKFMHNVKWVNILKLRASYGIIGNDDLDSYYPWRSTYSLYRHGMEAGYLISKLGNKSLTWESSYNLDVALEFTILNSRLNGTIEFFNRKSDDLLFSLSPAPSTGIGEQDVNAGSMKNTGIEISLDGDVIRTKNWKWSLNFNATHVKNKILELPMDPYKTGLYFITPGRSRYEFYIKQWAGVNPETGYNLFEADLDAGYTFEENELIYKGDVALTENIEHARYDFSGSSMPKLTGGFGTNLSYKNWQLGVSFYYQLGGKYYDLGYAELMTLSESNYAKVHKDLLKRWREPGDKTNIAKITSGTDKKNIQASSSTRWLTTSNMLEITNINLSYSIPEKILRHLNIRSASVYFAAANPFMFAKRDGMYPRREFMSGYVANSDIYHPSRTFSFGVNLSF